MSQPRGVTSFPDTTDAAPTETLIIETPQRPVKPKKKPTELLGISPVSPLRFRRLLSPSVPRLPCRLHLCRACLPRPFPPVPAVPRPGSAPAHAAGNASPRCHLLPSPGAREPFLACSITRRPGRASPCRVFCAAGQEGRGNPRRLPSSRIRGTGRRGAAGSSRATDASDTTLRLAGAQRGAACVTWRASQKTWRTAKGRPPRRARAASLQAGPRRRGSGHAKNNTPGGPGPGA